MLIVSFFYYIHNVMTHFRLLSVLFVAMLAIATCHASDDNKHKSSATDKAWLRDTTTVTTISTTGGGNRNHQVYFDNLRVLGSTRQAAYVFNVKGRGKMKARFTATLYDVNTGKPVYSKRQVVTLKPRRRVYGDFITPLVLPLSKTSEQYPVHYRMTITMDGFDEISTEVAFNE